MLPSPSETAGVADEAKGNEDMFWFPNPPSGSMRSVHGNPVAKRRPPRDWGNEMPNGYSAAAGPIKLDAMIPLFGKLNLVMATSQTS